MFIYLFLYFYFLLRISIDPSLGTPVIPQSICGASKEDVDDAVKSARKAFRETWGLNVTGTERSRLINRLADVRFTSSLFFSLS